jgi:hypothetical protein
MGTITIGINSSKLLSDIDYDLKQYLSEINPLLRNSEKDKLKLNRKNQYLEKTGYKVSTYGFIDDKFIFLSSSPKNFFHCMYDYKLTVHFSQWMNLQEIVEVFIRVFGFENARSIFFSGTVLRVDFWLDLEISYNKLKQTIYRPGVAISDQRKGERRSFYLGARGPRQAVFYEKPFTDRADLDLRLKKATNNTLMTRVEVRYSGKAVPFRTFADYASSADFKPFDILKTSFLSISKLSKFELSKRTNRKIDEFISCVLSEGIHHARKKFNKNRNFYRTIQPILDKISNDLNLSGLWAKKIKRKIVGNFDIEQYFYENDIFRLDQYT